MNDESRRSRWIGGIKGAAWGYITYTIFGLIGDGLGFLPRHPEDWWLRMLARVFLPLAVFDWKDSFTFVQVLTVLSWTLVISGFALGFLGYLTPRMRRIPKER